MNTVVPGRSAWVVGVARGTLEEYDALACFHYRAGRPATAAMVLTARVDGALAGVLVVSMPVLNGPWRAGLWPGVFEGSGKGSAARAVNRSLRTISRVIVEPRFRAMGVATALVRAYLRAPITRYTDAVAAIGAWCPFFASAGMRAVDVAPARRDVRLARDLRRLHVPAWTLLDADHAARRMQERAVAAAVRRWAREGKGTRRLLGDGTGRPAAAWELAVVGATSVLSRPVAYGFDAKTDAVRGPDRASAGRETHDRAHR